MIRAFILCCVLAACAAKPIIQPARNTYCENDTLINPPTEIADAVAAAMARGDIAPEIVDRWATAALDHDDRYVALCGGWKREP